MSFQSSIVIFERAPCR